MTNEASNSQNKMEWREKWDEEGNEKTCTKWGKSEDEEMVTTAGTPARLTFFIILSCKHFFLILNL